MYSKRVQVIDFITQYHFLEDLSLNKVYFPVAELVLVNFSLGYKTTKK